MRPILFSALALIAVSASAVPSGTENADMTREMLFPVNSQKGLTHFRVVMTGVLYRGGTEARTASQDGPRSPISDEALKALCKAGFSQSVYAYRTNWGGREKQISCDSGKITYDYHQWDNRSKLKIIFTKLQDIIVNRKGAMYVHCWYGLHASGYVAATALRQFCGLSGETAAQYWESVIPRVLRYPEERAKVAAFQPFPDIQISREDAARVCPSIR